ncbi:hypothetical protein L0B53_09725 [Vibrio sp. SS-MA-C1-2]|uniref:hypothetical protein n=1 Tax=Vibrio sp. SS-MA-C1-2 TaxID=2908646 RepID=UPI001F292C5E|nr:hypothetical protein [Vibrio sp. SS-MA-C1-2]UJF19749.1 hypothetical protein L0B53_09725 [Vibrio sp. SS-MA-C1-2]
MNQYQVIYFDGMKMTSATIFANDQKELKAKVKEYGFYPSDIYRIDLIKQQSDDKHCLSA